jgi:hypothetical protein
VPRRRAGLAVIITLGVVAAAVALTGTVVAASRDTHPAKFRTPLKVYPVRQTTPGQCAPGTQGVTGPGTQGVTCYQVAQGIVIRRVTDIHVQRGGTGYEVSMSLLPADTRSFAALTRRMTGGSLALVVGDRLVTAPSVQGPITEGKLLITGATRQEDAERLVRVLKGTTPPPAPPTVPPTPIIPTSPVVTPTGSASPSATIPGATPSSPAASPSLP